MLYRVSTLPIDLGSQYQEKLTLLFLAFFDLVSTRLKKLRPVIMDVWLSKLISLDLERSTF
jgi:hypothetical protein